MQKKNKVMLAAAIGMVAVVIGSTAVRCSIAHTVEESAEAEAQAATVSIAQDVGSADSAGASPATDESAEIAKVLQGNVWQAEGAPERTVEFRDRSFVESDGASVKLTVFDVKEAGEGNGQKHLDIDFMREGDPYTTPASIIVEERDGALTVASDAFAAESRYVQGKPEGTAVGVSGLAEPYTGLVDGKTAELASAIGSWCASHSPSATTGRLRRRGVPGRARRPRERHLPSERRGLHHPHGGVRERLVHRGRIGGTPWQRSSSGQRRAGGSPPPSRRRPSCARSCSRAPASPSPTSRATSTRGCAGYSGTPATGYSLARPTCSRP